MNEADFTIAAVERDTGLSKDVLRVWERRYGFPAPTRDSHGERVYPAEQVARLRLIKRLMDQGHRPGKLIAAAPESLSALAPRRAKRHAAPSFRPADTPLPSVPPADAGALPHLLEMIRQHDAVAFLQALQGRLAGEGLIRFVMDTVAPLTVMVGRAWEQGELEVYEEHLFTELIQRLLRQAMASLPPRGTGPRMVLTTVPDERHQLGLLMAEAVFALEGAHCIPLGTQMPLHDIAKAATAHQAVVVAVSFSAAYPHRQIGRVVEQLVSLLPPGVQLWAGGAGVARLPDTAGVVYLRSFDEVRKAVAGLSAAASTQKNN